MNVRQENSDSKTILCRLDIMLKIKVVESDVAIALKEVS